MQSLGETLTLGGPTDPQLPENTVRGIGAALAVIVVGLSLARFGGQGSNGGSARRVAAVVSTSAPAHSDTQTEAIDVESTPPGTEAPPADTEAVQPTPGE
jgi:hypothetical protein